MHIYGKQFYYLWFTLKVNLSCIMHSSMEESKKMKLWIMKIIFISFIVKGICLQNLWNLPIKPQGSLEKFEHHCCVPTQATNWSAMPFYTFSSEWGMVWPCQVTLIHGERIFSCLYFVFYVSSYFLMCVLKWLVMKALFLMSVFLSMLLMVQYGRMLCRQKCSFNSWRMELVAKPHYQMYAHANPQRKKSTVHNGDCMFLVLTYCLYLYNCP